MINHKPPLEELNQMNKGNMGEHLDIVYTAIGDDFLEGTMPVDHRTKQPFGLLHGGASVVLAESLGSMAANLCINPEFQYCVGLDINSNHLRSVQSGRVRGRASIIHIGKKTQVWEIRIFDEKEKLVNISRLTMAVLDKQK